MTALPLSPEIDQSTPEYAERVAALNDLFRQTGRGGRTVVTPGISALGVLAILSLQRTIAELSHFTPEDDPHGWRDFGAIRAGSEHVFWKIDYYDPACEHGSEDPADAAKTCRVLTIMFASEY